VLDARSGVDPRLKSFNESFYMPLVLFCCHFRVTLARIVVMTTVRLNAQGYWMERRNSCSIEPTKNINSRPRRVSSNKSSMLANHPVPQG
jgi:hypothetical protein